MIKRINTVIPSIPVFRLYNRLLVATIGIHNLREAALGLLEWNASSELIR